MGSGSWSTNVYDEHRRFKARAGKSTFDYSDRLQDLDRSAWRAHPSLNPHGVKIRESRDGDEHPASTSIAVMFDVTGSMGEVPVTLQKKLPELLGLLLRKSYVNDPQILFGAIGDATCDRVPLQVGQFESDNRMDENLENMFLEGGGGGQRTESYELAMYFIARHTDIDCWNMRGHKGYLFFIGDEMAYPAVKRREVQQVIGDGLEQDIPLAEIVKELRRRYHVFYILPKAASYGGDREILGFWRKLLGQNVLELDDPEAVCEVIALSIGMTEGTIDLPAGIEDLKEYAVEEKTLQVITSALAVLPKSLVKAKGGALPGLGVR
ncbi:MAG: hypothetical protein EHM21_09085 [Chloroflexi bacterium]|nr:MAG: hypothetical protein EHM21_09085 [Chloroflexota bacterium]